MSHEGAGAATAAAPHGSGHDAGEPQGSQAAWRRHHTVFTNAKGGMVGVDMEHVQRVVYEMSKNSAHFKNEQRKQAQTEERIARLKKQAAALSQGQVSGHQRTMDALVAQLAAGRDLTATWLVVDMDAFFASVEELHDPSLKHKPMAVGGIGMVSTANYVARRYGVRSAMPGFIGRRLCPELVFVRPDFQRYVAVSKQTRKIFADFDPDMEAGSLDEAFLDITSYCTTHNMTGAEVGEALRQRVREETGVTCSVGIAPNCMLAKVCADRNKPDGQYVLPATLEAVNHFVSELPIRKVPGIGKVTEQILKAFGVMTCGHLVEQRAVLSALFSKVAADYFMRVGLGLGRTSHSDATPEGEVGRKGISCERTFDRISAPADLEAKMAEIAEHLAEDMAEEGLQGRTVTVKLKSATTFELHTRAATLPNYVSTAEELTAIGLRLMRAEYPLTLRLIGIRVSAFKERPAPPPGQKTLSGFIHVKEEPPAAEGAGEDAASDPASTPSTTGQEAAAAACCSAEGGTAAAGVATGLAHSSGFSATEAELLPPDDAAAAQQQTKRRHPEPDWFVGGRNGADGFASCAPGRSFAASKASLMGPSSQASRGVGSPAKLTLQDWAAADAAHPEAEDPSDLMDHPAEDAHDMELSLRDWQPGQGGASSQPPNSQPRRQRPAPWRCRTCTYINPQHLLRCELCEVPRRGALSCDGPSQVRNTPGSGNSSKVSRTLPSQHPAKEKCRQISRFFGDAPPPAATAESIQQAADAVPDQVPPADQASAPALDALATPGDIPVPGDAAAAAARVETPEGQWLCERCGKTMAEERRAEHSDWHFADDLQREPGVRQRDLPGGTQNGSSNGSRKRQQSPVVTINALLSRHKRKSGAG